jgi:hypothetical protein
VKRGMEETLHYQRTGISTEIRIKVKIYGSTCHVPTDREPPGKKKNILTDIMPTHLL